jgi:hypothetical protein
MKTMNALLIAALSLAACKRGYGVGTGSGTYLAAKDTFEQFLKPGADPVALTNALRPKAGDYEAMFVGEAAAKAKAAMDPLWDSGKLTIRPAADQTELDIAGVSQANLAKGSGNADGCPEAYRVVADKINPTLDVYCIRFRKPGEKKALVVDGLVVVNGHLALFPKPWAALGITPPPPKAAASGAPSAAASGAPAAPASGAPSAAPSGAPKAP